MLAALMLAGLLDRAGDVAGAAGPPLDLRAPLSLAALLGGGAQALAMIGADRRLRPTSWVTRLGLFGGAIGAALWMLAGAAGLAAPSARSAGVLAELAPVGVGAWALCASAAAWKLRVWPRWLRVVGTVFGAAAMVQPGFPPAALISLLAGLGWWVGLGVLLIRGSRSTAG